MTNDPSPELPFGTALALAQRTLTAPLIAILADEDIEMPAWFTLNALGLRGSAPVPILAGLLRPNGLDEDQAGRLFASLSAAGLVEQVDGGVSLTPSGRSRYEALRDRITAAGSRLFAAFEPERVEDARRLLQQIAESDPQELVARVV